MGLISTVPPLQRMGLFLRELKSMWSKYLGHLTIYAWQHCSPPFWGKKKGEGCQQCMCPAMTRQDNSSVGRAWEERHCQPPCRQERCQDWPSKLKLPATISQEWIVLLLGKRRRNYLPGRPFTLLSNVEQETMATSGLAKTAGNFGGGGESGRFSTYKVTC